MAENVHRKRSGSVTLKQGRGKTKSEENAAAGDMTKGTIKDDVVRKVTGGRSKGGIPMAKRSQSKGELQIISDKVLADANAKKSDAWAKITGEEGSTKTKSVLDNEEDFSTPLKRKRGADAEIVLAYYSSQEISPRLRPRQVPTFRAIELGENDEKRIIDKRIKVYWPESRKWFTGHIKAFDDNQRLHTVLYDDGDKEELDLRKERFELEILPTEGFNLRADSISKKRVKSLDGNEVSAPVLPETTSEDGDAKEVMKSPELKTKDASKKVGRRVLSKLQRKSTRINQDSAVNMEKMNAGKEMDVQHDDEAKKSKLGGDINMKNAVEVNPQAYTNKTEALEEADDKNGGSSYEAQATIVDVPAEENKVSGDMEEKQEKPENITVSEDAAISPGMKSNVEDHPPNVEDTNPAKYYNDRKSVLKEASEVSAELQQPRVESSLVITSKSASASANKLHLPKNQEEEHPGMLQESQKAEKGQSAEDVSKKEME